MTATEVGSLILSRLLFVSVYLLVPALLCLVLTRGRDVSQGFRLWVWRGFFVVTATVLVVGPLIRLTLLGPSAGSAGGAGVPAWALGLWVLGVGYVAVRLAREERVARRLLETCEPVLDPALLSLTAEIGGKIGLKRAVSLVTTSSCRTPMVVFEKEPVVVLPEWALATLTREELAQVLAHEMAHIRGRDGAWAAFHCLVTGLLWFHPVVWMAGKQAAIAAEMQADAVALRFSASCPANLAKTILLCVTGAQPSHVAALSGNGRKLAMRLRALERTNGKVRRLDLAGAVAAVLLCAPVIPVQAPQVKSHTQLFSPISIASPVGTYKNTPSGIGVPVGPRRLGP